MKYALIILLFSQCVFAQRIDQNRFLECQGRLTLRSGDPIPTESLGGKTLYFTPYNGNRIALHNGTVWEMISFAEVSVVVPSTASTPFDVFGYNNGGSFALETVNWTNDTARATALTTQDGVYVKNGASTRRYLGTGRTTTTNGMAEDSRARRFVWNACNPVIRSLYNPESAETWQYRSPKWRAANNNFLNRIEFVQGLPLVTTISARAVLRASPSDSAATVGIGLDNSIDPVGNSLCHGDTFSHFDPHLLKLDLRAEAKCGNSVGMGYHYFQLLEKGDSKVTSFYGDFEGEGFLSFIEAQISG